MKNTAGCVVAVLVLGSVLGSAIEGQAANLEVQFIDMTNNLLATCRDNAACDSAGAVGTIIFNLAVAGASAEGVATAAPGPFGLTLLYDVGGTAANNYRFAISEDDLSGSNLVWTGGVGGTQSGIDTTSFDVFAHTGNVKFLGDTGVCQAGTHASFPRWDEGYWATKYWTDKWEVEEAIRAAGFEHWTLLRPSFIMENFLAAKAQFLYPQLKNGVIVTPVREDSRLQLIAGKYL